MMSLTLPKPVVLYPSPVLREVCEPFDGVSSLTKELARKLRETLGSTTGIGLAAPQIGTPRRMILLRCDPKTSAGGGLVMIDPVVVSSSETKTLMMEGCLSLPGERFPVVRPEKVIIEYLSVTGRIRTAEMVGLAAKCVQHEIDHLDGVLILDRASQTPFGSLTTDPTARATASHLSRSR